MSKIFTQATTRLLSNGEVEIIEYDERTGARIEQNFIYFNDEWNRSRDI